MSAPWSLTLAGRDWGQQDHPKWHFFSDPPLDPAILAKWTKGQTPFCFQRDVFQTGWRTALNCWPVIGKRDAIIVYTTWWTASSSSSLSDGITSTFFRGTSWTRVCAGSSPRRPPHALSFNRISFEQSSGLRRERHQQERTAPNQRQGEAIFADVTQALKSYPHNLRSWVETPSTTKGLWWIHTNLTQKLGDFWTQKKRFEDVPGCFSTWCKESSLCWLSGIFNPPKASHHVTEGGDIRKSFRPSRHVATSNSVE